MRTHILDYAEAASRAAFLKQLEANCQKELATQDGVSQDVRDGAWALARQFDRLAGRAWNNAAQYRWTM